MARSISGAVALTASSGCGCGGGSDAAGANRDGAPDPLDGIHGSVLDVVPRQADHDVAEGGQALVAGAIGLESLLAVESPAVEFDDRCGGNVKRVDPADESLLVMDVEVEAPAWAEGVREPVVPPLER